MDNLIEKAALQSLVDAHVFGARNEWEKHELGEKKSFVKPLQVRDPGLRARVAERYAEMGFVPHLFKESGQDYVALESVTTSAHYRDIEDAFAEQILSKL